MSQKELKFKGATLLPVSVARKLGKSVLKSSVWWWLRDADVSASEVSHVGQVYCVDGTDGTIENMDVYSYRGVRPALEIANFDESGFRVGQKFQFNNHLFTVITKDYALSDYILTETYFNYDNKSAGCTDYEKSDIKKEIDRWYARNEYTFKFWEEKEMPGLKKCVDKILEGADIKASITEGSSESLTVGELIDLLEGFDPEMPVVLKGANSSYVDSVSGVRSASIRSSWGNDFESAVILGNDQVGSV